MEEREREREEEEEIKDLEPRKGDPPGDPGGKVDLWLAAASGSTRTAPSWHHHNL